ncbi:MAG: MarR family EPS-associated transcriptional regulator [Desulfobulbaceae bacterium]
MNTSSTEIRYRILKILEQNPDLTQRQLAEKLGLSLGKCNYCLRELVKKGIVKIERFTSSSNKAGYLYVLTPHGIEQKAKITAAFLQRKMREYEELQREIQELRREVRFGADMPPN